jgi:hypothetical protein
MPTQRRQLSGRRHTHTIGFEPQIRAPRVTSSRHNVASSDGAGHCPQRRWPRAVNVRHARGTDRSRLCARPVSRPRSTEHRSASNCEAAVNPTIISAVAVTGSTDHRAGKRVDHLHDLNDGTCASAAARAQTDFARPRQRCFHTTGTASMHEVSMTSRGLPRSSTRTGHRTGVSKPGTHLALEAYQRSATRIRHLSRAAR